MTALVFSFMRADSQAWFNHFPSYFTAIHSVRHPSLSFKIKKPSNLPTAHSGSKYIEIVLTKKMSIYVIYQKICS